MLCCPTSPPLFTIRDTEHIYINDSEDMPYIISTCENHVAYLRTWRNDFFLASIENKIYAVKGSRLCGADGRSVSNVAGFLKFTLIGLLIFRFLNKNNPFLLTLSLVFYKYMYTSTRHVREQTKCLGSISSTGLFVKSLSKERYSFVYVHLLHYSSSDCFHTHQGNIANVTGEDHTYAP